MKLEFYWKKQRKTEQASWTSLSKQSKTKRINFLLELESIKLEFHWEKQGKTEQYNRTSLSKQSKTKGKIFSSGTRVYETRVPLEKTEHPIGPL